jgi:hypothetical protein
MAVNLNPMYNLLVSANDESWDGSPWEIEQPRCVREYTDDRIAAQWGKLTAEDVNELRRHPCIFAYESGCKKDPRFGVIRDVVARQGQVRITYELFGLDHFLTHCDLADLAFELDIWKWELNRTHWAVKDVDLARELHAKGITLPHWARAGAKAVDITTHGFDVALSFPGESRDYVENVAKELERLLGPHAYFYDNNYVSQLARPNLDVLLQEIYGIRSGLVVVFLSRDYQDKEWCGVEFRAIREIIMKRETSRVMFVRLDDGGLDGVFKTDGYIDARKFSPHDVARFVEERVSFSKKQ